MFFSSLNRSPSSAQKTSFRLAKSCLSFLPLLAVTLLATPAGASTELSASQILDKALANGAIGFSKGSAVLEMIIRDERGVTKRRTLAVKAMKDEDGLLKTLLKFERPAEVAGMGFLVLQNADRLPDQFIYMPAARVTKRIPAGKATGSLFGSDFAYIDLMPLPPSEREQAKLTRLENTKVAGRDNYVISTAIDVMGSPYSKLVTYVDTKLLIPLRIEFFDPEGKHLKTLKVKQLTKVDGRTLPSKLVMKNVQQGTQTTVKVSGIKADAPLSARDFTEEALQR